MYRKLGIAIIFAALLVSAVSADIFVARGDPLQVQEIRAQGTCWYFPELGPGQYYNMPSSFEGNKTYCRLNGLQTHNMPLGRYTLVYVEPAYVNGKYFSDVSWKDNHIVSSLSNTIPKDEAGAVASAVRKDLLQMISANGLNTYRETRFEIQEPEFYVIDIGRVGENVFRIRGSSNLADKTPITIKVDDKRYYAQHNDTFSYKTEIVRNSSSSYGNWSKDMLMPLQSMPPGWHDIAVYSGDLSTTVRFYVDEQEWGPQPTPTQYVKYLTNGNLAPEIVVVVQTVVKTEYVDRWHTATPTPSITDALGNMVEYPYKPGGEIPVWVGIVCLGIVIVLVLVRGYTWK